MKGLENPDYLFPYIISNVVGLLLLLIAFKRPRLARLLFFLLFAWACWMNYTTVHKTPEVYLEYASMSVGWYRDFIQGWFSDHIITMVTLIAIGQACIALGMLLKGWFVRLACIGVIVFLLSIAPLGVGAAFPFSITVGLAAFFVLKKDKKNFLWKVNK